MRILVLIKQIPARDCTLQVSANGTLLEQPLTYETNGPDAYALEAGLQLRDKVGGEVVVVCAGPDRVGQTIREALAKGADRAVHVRLPDLLYIQPFALGTALANAIQSEACDLLLTGLQAEDDCQGQTGVVLAEILRFRHATIVTEIQPMEGAVRVRKELEHGFFQHVTLPLPVALSVQSGSGKPRLATMMGIKQAKTKPVRICELPDAILQNLQGSGLEQVYPPERSGRSEFLSGDPKEAARRLIEQLRFEARLL